MTQLDVAAPPAQTPAPAARYSATPRQWLKLLWPALALAFLLVFDFFFVPNFFRVTLADGRLAGTPIEIFRVSGPVILLAVGMTLVLATGGVDLSVGAVMALAGAVTAELSTGLGWSPASAALAALAASVVAGLWNGALVTLLDIQPIVATLVLMVAGRGIATKISGSAHVAIGGGLFNFMGGYVLGVPTEGLVGLLVFAATLAFTRLTSAGLLIEATGGNPTASRFAGVNVRRVMLAVYVFSGLCAGLAGLLKTADVQGADASTLGLFYELDAILAAVIGGTALTGGRFSLVGAVLGSVLIVTLTTTIQSKVPAEYALIAKALVVIAVCLLQSEAFRRKVIGRFVGRRG